MFCHIDGLMEMRGIVRAPSSHERTGDGESGEKAGCLRPLGRANSPWELEFPRIVASRLRRDAAATDCRKMRQPLFPARATQTRGFKVSLPWPAGRFRVEIHWLGTIIILPVMPRISSAAVARAPTLGSVPLKLLRKQPQMDADEHR